MPKQEKARGAGDFVAVLLRRKRALLATAAAVAAVALTVAMALPDTFAGKALLVIDPSKFPDQFNGSVRWFPPVDERLETLFRAARSRRELRALCDRFGLYRPEDAGLAERLPVVGPLVSQLLGDAPDRLARDLQCDVLPPPPNRPKEQRIIQVAFSAGDAKTAAGVTNAFAFRLADIEHEFSLAHFDEAIAFLETSAAASRDALAAKSREVLDWKALHQDSLPERAADLRHELDTLQAQALANERAISESESRLDGYVQQAGVGAATAQALGLAPGVPVDRRLELLRGQIGELTLALADLRIRNLDTHPDVRRVSALLAAAQAEYKALTEGADAVKRGEEPQGPPVPKDPAKLAEVPPSSPLFAAYSAVVNLREGEKRQLEILRRERNRLDGEQARVSLVLSKIPETERKLSELEGEVLALRKVDDERQGQLEKARTMREVERQRKSEQLRVIEAAEPSPLPDGPDRLKIAILGVVIALGAGAGAAFLQDARDTSFRSAEDAAARLDAPVLVALPKIGA
jgi:uncharacterized protein involved in exopolysaccharide biosynthesis